jgi:hypothetical protein
MIDPYYVSLANQASGSAVLTALHYGYPIAVFVYYLVSSAVAVCTLQTKSSDEGHKRQNVIKWLFLFSILTFLAQLLALILQGIVRHRFPLEQDLTIGLLSCILVFGVEFAGLSDSPNPVWYPFLGSLALALVFEPIICVLSLTAVPLESLGFVEVFVTSAAAARYLAFALAFALYFEGSWNGRKEKGIDSERQSLLKPDENGSSDANKQPNDEEEGEQQQNGYGTAETSEDESTDTNKTAPAERVESPWERREREAREQMEKRLKEKGNWFTYARSFMVCPVSPLTWPRKRLTTNA